MNDRSEIASAQTLLRQVAIKNYGIELFEPHRVSPGKAGTKRRRGSACQNVVYPAFRIPFSASSSATFSVSRSSSSSGWPPKLSRR
jgi:hypothetical protein